VAPAFHSAPCVSKELKDSTVRLAAQNVVLGGKGAFTGEVSPLMLKEMDCVYVIVGHSERRQFFAETDKTVNCNENGHCSRDETDLLASERCCEEGGESNVFGGRKADRRRAQRHQGE